MATYIKLIQESVNGLLVAGQALGSGRHDREMRVAKSILTASMYKVYADRKFRGQQFHHQTVTEFRVPMTARSTRGDWAIR